MNRKRAARIVLLFCLWASAGNERPAQAADAVWRKVESPHFELLTTEGERTARETVGYFERIRDFFLETLNAKPPEERILIIAFRSIKEFEPYRPNSGAAAFYLNAGNRDFIVMGSIGENAQQIAVHEYIHLLVRHSGINLPIWLNEGIADLYSNLQPLGKNVRVGNLIPGRVYQLRERKWLPLERLASVVHESPEYNEKDHQGMFYAQSWLLTHMLYTSEAYREKKDNFVLAIANGATTASAFESIYGKSLKAVEQDLHSYMRSNRVYSILYGVKLEKSSEEITAREAPQLEARLALAELTAATSGRREEAHRQYAELAEAYPDSGDVRAAWGYLYLREQRIEEGRQKLSEAVERGAAGAQLFFDYAMLLHRDPATRPKMIPWLEKAIGLRPRFNEARLYLAFLFIDTREFLKAVIQLAQIQHVEREKAFDFYRATAYARMQLGDKEQAKVAFELATKYAESPSQIATIHSLGPFIRGEVFTASRLVAPSDPGPPRLEQRPAQPPRETAEQLGPEATVSVSGVLEHFDCLGSRARLRVNAGGESKAFLIVDPSQIVLTGANAGTFEFECGPQSSRPIVLEYKPTNDAETETLGEVRVIHLQ